MCAPPTSGAETMSQSAPLPTSIDPEKKELASSENLRQIGPVDFGSGDVLVLRAGGSSANAPAS